MSEYLLFWPKAAVLAYVDGAAGFDAYIYTKALPTNGFTEVVAQLECDDKIISDSNSSITVTPQISNDGVNWKSLTSDAFTAVNQASSYPVNETKKITTIGAFMRFQIKLAQGGGVSKNVGGTLMLSAVGRDNDRSLRYR